MAKTTKAPAKPVSRANSNQAPSAAADADSMTPSPSGTTEAGAATGAAPADVPGTNDTSSAAAEIGKTGAEESAPASANESEGSASDVLLVGSSLKPAFLRIGDRDVHLGEIVSRAHLESGLSAIEWNELPDFEREREIEQVVIAMRREAPASESPVYIACWPLKFGGKKFGPGMEIPTLSDGETKSLLKLKAIQLA